MQPDWAVVSSDQHEIPRPVTHLHGARGHSEWAKGAIVLLLPPLPVASGSEAAHEHDEALSLCLGRGGHQPSVW